MKKDSVLLFCTFCQIFHIVTATKEFFSFFFLKKKVALIFDTDEKKINDVMGIVFSNRIVRICAEDEEIPARLLLVGLDSSGKSTLLRRLENLVQIQLDSKVSFIENIPTTPTFVYQVETINMPLAPLPLNIWDLGGRARQLWKFYLTGVEGNGMKRFLLKRIDSIR